jgi:1,4-alpha-glucan branching enzyme
MTLCKAASLERGDHEKRGICGAEKYSEGKNHVEEKYLRMRHEYRVAFELPGEVNAKTAFLCGEFNNWDTTSYPMKRHKDGSFALTISLKPHHRYRYWHFLDGER